MERILNDIYGVLENMGMRDASGRLRQIHAAYKRGDWRLGIVGAFSRGKTHLVNLLLDSDLLPEDVLPSTTVLTEIAYSPWPKIEFIGENGVEMLDPASLELFSAGNERSDVAGILKINIPNDFLKPNLLLYDTPGIDDLLEARADITFEALQFCDAVLVVISAASPLGLNEREFIEGYLKNRQNPKIALVVSFLDQMDEKAAARQMRNISESAARIYPAMEIWSATPDLPPELCDASGVAAMRKKIRQWAEDPDNDETRTEWFRKDAASLLEYVIRVEESFLRKLEQERKGEREELEKARKILHEQGQDWTDLRNNFLDASLLNLEKLQELVLASVRDMEEGPQEGGNSRARLREVTNRLASAAQKNFNEDVSVLVTRIRDSYGLSPDFGMGMAFSASEINEELCPYMSGNNESIRLLLDLMDRHASEIILWLPLPALGQRIARELARRFLIMARKKYDDPAQRLAAYRQSLDSASRDLRQMLRDAYAGIAEQVLEMRGQWLKESQERLEVDNNGQALKKEMEARAHNLEKLKDLRARLAGGAETA